ncbi:DNA (cytosine-5-)-methyltransferase [Candidatus Woesebacteria bacterium]|nr:MAG: DNA (cytosine-5-)-methyltransferase [Candidatus Woesebacteria bacterium]
MSKTSKTINGKSNKFTFIDLFAGIGGFRMALEELGGMCIFSSEWDKNSQSTYSANFGDTPQGDITKIKEKNIPRHDVLCAGFPCQAFSISGKRLGFDDTRGTLFRDIARIAKYHQPKILFLENVKNLLRHDNGNTIKVIENTLNEVGYNTFIKVLRSSDYGVPQARERVYMVAFRKDLNVTEFTFPNNSNSLKVVKDIIEPEINVDKDCYINRSDMEIYGDEKSVNDPRRPLQIGKINKGGQGERIYSIYASGITLSAYGGGAASKTGAYFINNKVRKLTPRECARLQGYPESFVIPVKRNIAYKQFGDSVSVPVLIAIFKKVLETYPLTENEKSLTKKRGKIEQLNLETYNV